MQSKNLKFCPSREIKIRLDENGWKGIADKQTISKMCQEENAFAYDVLLDDAVVGFALFRPFGDGVFLWQYAIDQKYQSGGLGFAALKQLVEKIRTEKHIKYFTTTYNYGNERAKNLYEKLGFTQTDVVDEDGIHEVNMQLYL